MWKIRSMIPGADKKFNIEKLVGKSELEDPRVTQVGKILRKYKLDEIIQLLYVLTGEMSIVGTRPMSIKFFDFLINNLIRDKVYLDEWIRCYNSLPKGLTNVAYILGINTKNNKNRKHPDMFYFKNASLKLDMYILWKTIQAIVQSDRYRRRRKRK